MPKLDFSGSADSTSEEGFGASAIDWFKGFGRSALESIPEMVGINPSTETQQWRADHPVGDFTSQMLGLAVPYTGWFKAVKFIKPIEEAAAGLQKGKGFLGGALGIATRLAPLEAGRLAANAAVGDQTFSQMLGETTTDLAFMSGVGGLLHGIASAGARDPKLPSIFPGIDVSLPLPLMARYMRDYISSGKITDLETLGRAKAKLADTLNLARSEELPRSQRYVGDIAQDSLSPSGKTDTVENILNRFFKGSGEDPGEKSITQVKKFAVGDKQKDFDTTFNWKTAAQEAGLPDGFEEHGQFFRNISWRQLQQGVDSKITEKKAKHISNNFNDTVTKNMQSVGDDNFMAREADEGMFIVARKYEGDPKKGLATDKWVLFKTDKPGYFLEDQDKWAKYQVALSKWVPNSEPSPDAGPVYNSATGYSNTFPLRNWQVLAGNPSKVKDLVSSLLPQNLLGKSNEAVARMGEALNSALSPRIWQFRNSFRASWIVNGVAKTTYDAAATTTNELMYGKTKIDPGWDLYYNAIRKGQKTGLDGLTPVFEILKPLSDADIKQFWEKVWVPRLSPKDIDSKMANGDISPEVAKAAKQLEAVNDWKNVTTQKVEEATGKKPTEFPVGSYGLQRTWEGDTRIIIRNDSGQVVAQAGGPNRRAAQQLAQKLLKENPDWKIGTTTEGAPEEISLSRDPAGLGKLLSKSSGSLVENQNLRGFKWDLEAPTKQELLKEYESQLGKAMNYQANMTVTDLMTPQLSALQRENPVAYKQAVARLRDFAGAQSDFGKIQNAIVDNVLGPIMGPNSASKIVGLTNTAMSNLTLGAMKLSYPIINALQFVQTVVPETAFVLGKAVSEDLSPYYSHFAAGGTKGPIGGMAVLNPIKMMGRALRMMRNPDADLSGAFERAANERVIEPRMVEDYIGASASRVSDLRQAISSGKDFVGWLRALSEFLPAETERLSRTHAFTVGYDTAKQFLKTAKGEALNSDQAYRFAKEFTEKTMYLYSTADKSRIFTTPAGSLMGLFKNWMFHYMSSMLDYTKQGATKNNWAPLLWQMGGTFGLGGMAAMPAYGVANNFSKWWSDKSVMQQAYEHFDEKADWMLYGLPALMGVSLTSSVDTPALSDPVRDGSSLFSVAAWSRAQALSKSIGAAFDNWQTTGQHPGTDRATRENLIKAFAPVTLYRGLSAFADPNAITSLGTGYPIQKDPSLVNRLLYSAGFTPTELQRGYDISQALYDNNDALKSEEKKLSLAWAQAEMEGDSERLAIIMRNSMTWGVDVSRVIKDGMFELDKYRKDIIERHLKPKDIGAYRKVILGGRDED